MKRFALWTIVLLCAACSGRTAIVDTSRSWVKKPPPPPVEQDGTPAQKQP